MLTHKNFVNLVSELGYKAVFDEENLFYSLSSSNPLMADAVAYWPEEDGGLDFRFCLGIFKPNKNLLEILLFLSRFNWENFLGKVLYHPDSSELMYQLIFRQSLEEIDPGDFSLDIIMSHYLSFQFKKIFDAVYSGKLNAVDAINLLEEMVDGGMAEMMSGSSCGCNNPECDCGSAQERSAEPKRKVKKNTAEKSSEKGDQKIGKSKRSVKDSDPAVKPKLKKISQ